MVICAYCVSNATLEVNVIFVKTPLLVSAGSLKLTSA